MRTILLLVTSALAGCGGTDYSARQACAGLVNGDLGTWQRCMYSHRNVSRETRATRSDDLDDAGGLLLLGTGAFLNGYNAGRPRIT